MSSKAPPSKLRTTLRAIAWTLIMLIFPVLSGTVAVMTNIPRTPTIYLQGGFMLFSLVLPFLFHQRNPSILPTYLQLPPKSHLRNTLYYIPLILTLVPVMISGVDTQAMQDIVPILFFVIAVGIAEEVYFRGLILPLLMTNWSLKKSILISSLLFGIGHFAGALAGTSAVEIILTVINALVFGLIAALVVVRARSIYPVVLWHSAFNLVNRISNMEPSQVIISGGVQIGFMLIYSIWLWSSLANDLESS